MFVNYFLKIFGCKCVSIIWKVPILNNYFPKVSIKREEYCTMTSNFNVQLL